eukprot:gene3818-4168_t
MSDDYSQFRNKLSPYDNKVRTDKYAREFQIAVENMAVVRERLSDCIRTETINQFTACKELREKYFALCIDRFHGMLFAPGEEPVNRALPNITKKQQ